MAAISLGATIETAVLIGEPSLASATPEWSTVQVIDQANAATVAAISCPTASFCMAVDEEGNAMTWNGASWSSPSLVDSQPNAPVFRSVSCTGPTFCMAVDAWGYAVAFDGSSWSAPVLARTPDRPGSGLTAVSCSSSDFCLAVGGQDSLAYNGASWSAPAMIDPGSGFTPTSVSCPTSTFCAAVDEGGSAAKFNGSTWSTSTLIDPGNILNAVSCPSAGFCLAADDTGKVVTLKGTSWATPYYPDSVQGYPMETISCPTSDFCDVADLDGYVHTLAGGSSWSVTQLVNSSNPAGISCASSDFCVLANHDALGYLYQGVALSITATTLPSGAVHSHYSAAIAVVGGSPPYHFTTMAKLPKGLHLSSLGVVSGTPSHTGTFSFKVKATDRSRPRQATQSMISITIG